MHAPLHDPMSGLPSRHVQALHDAVQVGTCCSPATVISRSLHQQRDSAQYCSRARSHLIVEFKQGGTRNLLHGLWSFLVGKTLAQIRAVMLHCQLAHHLKDSGGKGHEQLIERLLRWR